MKRTITSMLGAFAVAAGLSLFAASASNAQVPGSGTFNNITCSYYSSGSNYPGPTSFSVCANLSTQSKNGYFGVISSETAVVRDELDAAYVRYFIFQNFNQYRDYFLGAGVVPLTHNPATGAPLNESDGFSVSNVTYPYTIIFLQAGTSPNYPEDYIDEVIAHETGHHLDYLWRDVFTSSLVSNSVGPESFDDLRAHDIFMLNNKWKAGNKYSKRKSCGSGGALVNLYDPVNQLYVCDGNSLRPQYQQYHTAGGNYGVLKHVYPTIDMSAELFADTFVVVSGNRMQFYSVYGSPTRMIQSEFACTKALVSSLRLRRTPPPSYNFNCTRSFIGTQEEPE